MTHRKRKKTSRMRGSHSHGWGDKKKRRGFGHSGGKGLAGRYTGSKKPSAWALGRKHNSGFFSINAKKTCAINVGDLNIMVENNMFVKKGSSYEADLSSLGYTKLLSKGKVKYPMSVTVDSATEDAVKKVSASGGSVTVKKE